MDAYGTYFFGKTPRDIAHLVRADRGLGTMDLAQVIVKEESA